ncbi:MAG: 2-succinyl-5-enolpyruvyl-6-hydroxy-3-cyclohexene-1-carboxylic-acid synthase [Ornithinimicrobium sp.]
MNPSTALATVLIDEWVRCGVREVVVCPGSRSAPLAYAAQAAEEAGALRLHVRVDERSAGFLALGLAKVSRQPAVVITTSGTAVANLHPAVLEAAHAGVPMIVMSADRPAELRGTGANQTTIQPGIFAGACQFEHDQPPAQGRVGEQASWRSTVCRAYAAAVGRVGDAGPVHLNVAFRDPLSPDTVAPDPSTPRPASASGSTRSEWPESLEGRTGGAPWVDGQVQPTQQRVEQTPPHHSVGQRSGEHPHTLMVLGDLPDPAMAAHALVLAHRQRWPVIAEPFGQRPAEDAALPLPHGPLLLADTALVDRYLPQRLIIVGRHTLHRDIAALARRTHMIVEQVSAVEQWSDPAHVVSRVYSWAEFLDMPLRENDTEWAQAWSDAAQELARRMHETAVLRGDTAGVSIASTVLRALGSGDTLVLGSSNTPRDLNLADPEACSRPLIVGNRGLSGIDGTVSCAVGAALADGGSGRVVALMGDLTFEHDINGLLIGPDEPRPNLTIVVNNDRGGGIFATLEYGKPEHAGQLDRLFTTQTGVDIGVVCHGYGVRHSRAETLGALRDALAERPNGLTVIEVVVDSATDQRARRELRAIAADSR